MAIELALVVMKSRFHKIHVKCKNCELWQDIHTLFYLAKPQLNLLLVPLSPVFPHLPPSGPALLPRLHRAPGHRHRHRLRPLERGHRVPREQGRSGDHSHRVQVRNSVLTLVEDF